MEDCPKSPVYESWADITEQEKAAAAPQKPPRRNKRPQLTQRPQPHLRYVQTAVHEALQTCVDTGKLMTYTELKKKAIACWEAHFSDTLARWDVVHSLPLTEGENRRRLPPFAKKLLEQSLEAFDSDIWCQTLLLTHDPKVLTSVQLADKLTAENPGLTFHELVRGMIEGIKESTHAVEPGQQQYLHFDKQQPDSDSSGWTKVHSKRRRYETLELTFPDMAWFYAFKIFCFPQWMHRTRTDFNEARNWRNLSDSEKHHNRILDHIRTVIKVQSELNQLGEQRDVDYSKPFEWNSSE